MVQSALMRGRGGPMIAVSVIVAAFAATSATSGFASNRDAEAAVAVAVAASAAAPERPDTVMSPPKNKHVQAQRAGPQTLMSPPQLHKDSAVKVNVTGVNTTGWTPQAVKEMFERTPVPIKVGLTPPERFWQVLPIIVVLFIAAKKCWGLSLGQGLAGQKLLSLKTVEAIAALALYFVSGPAVILINKHMIRNQNFHFPILLANISNVLIALITRTAVWTGLAPRYGIVCPAKPMDWTRYAKFVVPLNVFSFLSNALGMWAYLFISVPEIQVLKCFTVVFVMILCLIFGLERFDKMLVGGVCIIAAGTIISAAFDSDFSGGLAAVKDGLIGILLMVLASMSEAAKTVTCQVLVDQMSVFEALYWYSPQAILMAVILVCACELRGLIQQEWSGTLIGLLLANVVVTACVILSNFWLTKIVGGLAIKVLVTARNIILVLFSVLFFGESCTSLQYIGYSVALAGIALYEHCKALQTQAAQKALPAVLSARAEALKLAENPVKSEVAK